MSKLEDALLAAASCAEQVTVVCPSAKTLPEAGAHVTATEPSSESCAVGRAYVTLAPAPLVASATRLAWLWISGGVISTTLTPNWLEEWLPAASCAEQVT